MNGGESFRYWVSGFVAHTFWSQPNLSVIGGNGVMQMPLHRLKKLSSAHLSSSLSLLFGSVWLGIAGELG